MRAKNYCFLDMQCVACICVYLCVVHHMVCKSMGLCVCKRSPISGAVEQEDIGQEDCE